MLCKPKVEMSPFLQSRNVPFFPPESYARNARRNIRSTGPALGAGSGAAVRHQSIRMVPQASAETLQLIDNTGYAFRSRPLTAKAAKAATHSGKTPHTEWLADGHGHGLMLAMKPSGAKSWVQRIVVRGRRRAMGLGSFELVTLAEARDAVFANRRIAQRGGDPFENRRRPPAPTFAEAAAQVVDARAATWKNSSKSRAQWESTLAAYAFPVLGDMSVADIAGADVMKVLTPIWSAKRETASRLRQRISAVMQWAVAHGHRADDPAGTAVLQALPKGEAKTKRHHRALPHAEVASAVARTKASDAWIGTKLAFEFVALTASRSGEAHGATWDEIDVEAKAWTIRAERMKGGMEHRVPLSPRRLAVLAEARNLPRTAADLVFPSARGRQLADNAFGRLLRDCGVEAVPHGFRSSFRDWASECTDAPRAVMEAVLAHAARNQAEAAYARSDLFARRRELMDAWAAYVS